ncbi:hypothetical protein [Thiomicrorhabdus arctica]|uniref:hypothetical protein n=1 Tax=Thiomicrorhabdus arctica TaxID=131540 RepID=UPI000375BA22|nr:hypothetical protein [Thiomicrorhabdus arctica]
MKPTLLKIFAPILNLFEAPDDGSEYSYSPSHRKILMVMGFLFLGVTSVGIFFAIQLNAMATLLPIILFGSIGLLCLIVAGLGSDRAVSKLWRNR